MQQNELELIQRFQQGDNSAFDELVEGFQQQLYNLAWQWTHNKEDALDICQTAYIKLYKVLPKWKPKSSLFTWLYRVVINAAIDMQRKKKRRQTLPLDALGPDENPLEVIDESSPDPHNVLKMKEINQQIQQAIALLPPRQQQAFILRHLQGMHIEEIAGVMRCSQGAVKAHIFQASQKLRKELDHIRTF